MKALCGQAGIALIIASGCGCGGNSSSTEATDPPSPPELVVAAAETPGLVTVRWQPSDGADRYNVYWSTDHTQTVEAYAAYENSGLLSTGSPVAEIPISILNETLFISVTAENSGGESRPSPKAVALLALEVDPENPNVVLDHASDLRWRRCAAGQTLDPTTETCLGTETLLSDPEAADLFGRHPPSDGARAPRYEEVWTMSHCGVTYLHPDLRFDGWSDVPRCDDALDALFPNRGEGYPPYFMYYPKYSPQVYVCRSHVRADLNFAVSCRKPESTTDRMRYYLVTPM